MLITLIQEVNNCTNTILYNWDTFFINNIVFLEKILTKQEFNYLKASFLTRWQQKKLYISLFESIMRNIQKCLDLYVFRESTCRALYQAYKDLETPSQDCLSMIDNTINQIAVIIGTTKDANIQRDIFIIYSHLTMVREKLKCLS